jgi:cytoskeletal protein RodZ
MSNLGKSLKRERLKREITLTQISEKTNISINVLTALEDNKFDEIPGRFYLKNYLNSYLDAINIDKKIFFEENKEIINSVKIKNDSEPKIYFNKLRYSRFKKKNFLTPIVLIFILFVGSFYFFYTYRQDIATVFKSISGKKEIPKTGINFNSMFNRFSFDYSPINLEIIFEGNCWTQIIR